MANITVEVRTPNVPDHLYLDIPGREKGTKVPLSQLTEADLKQVGEAWTKELIDARAEQIRHGAVRSSGADEG